MKTPSTMARKRVHKGWVLHRFKNLPDLAETLEVRLILGISPGVVYQWLDDEYFQRARVAERINGRWKWHKELLRAWVMAVFKVAPKRPEAANPGNEDAPATPEAARAFFGMPEDYSVRMGRIKHERTDLRSEPEPESESTDVPEAD